jgi:hypothetical protein
MRLTRSRQRSSGHSAVAVLILGPAGRAGPGLALFPELMALIVGLPADPFGGCPGIRLLPAAADEPAGHRTPGLRDRRAAGRGITAVPAIIFGHMARRRVAGPVSRDLPERRRPSCSAGSRC